MYPLVIITGKAGSGKDTFAGFLAEHGSTCISQADPMKRFARDVFGFSTKQLWGPSECRNAPDPTSAAEFIILWRDGSRYKQAWLQDIGHPDASKLLEQWAEQHILGRENLTPRHVLQTLGTGFGRYVDKNLWSNYAIGTAEGLLEQGGSYIRGKGRVSGPEQSQFVVITDGRFKNEVLAVKAKGGLAVRIDGGGLEGTASSHASETEQNSIPNEWFDAVVVNNKDHGLKSLEHAATRFVEHFFTKPWQYRTHGGWGSL
jgi:hypothetical protein